jgi:UDP-arabinose 4-epimerase
MSMNILVTGGAGYIGSHACKALAQAGYTPVSYDSLVQGHRWAVRWGPLEVGDITDSIRLNEVISKYQPVAVMHFAAYAYVGESVQDPGKYYRNNVVGTLNLIESMRFHGINNLIFSSTCATFGVPKTIPINEAHSQSPISPYGASKLMIERILRDFEVAHGLRSISLRYFNAAGADPNGEIGEAHNPETHLIPLVLTAAANQNIKITVFGDDYDTPDGTCVRDYIHVSDLADAHILALKALEGGAKTTAYNLGNGKGFSVKEVIEAVEKVSGKPVLTHVGSRRGGDPAILVGDSTRIRIELGWNPRYSELQSMISSAWRWHDRASSAR